MNASKSSLTSLHFFLLKQKAISSYVWPCPGHSPTSCRAHKAHRCMMCMALVVAVTMRFAVCRNFKQLVLVSLGSTLSTTPNARLATHIETMRSITNTTIHATCCYSHTQTPQFSPRRPDIPRFLRAWLKHISLCLMEPQHIILQLHVPAMSTLQEVLLYFSGFRLYLQVSNCVYPVQHAPPMGGWQLDFCSDSRHCTIKTASLQPPAQKTTALAGNKTIYYDIWVFI